MGNVVVGYVPKPEGEAALTSAIAEAKLRGAKVVVVNSHRGGQDFDRAASDKVESEMEAVKSSWTRPGWSTRSGSWCAGSSPPRT